MSLPPPLAELAPTEVRATPGIELTLRRLEGPLARELHLVARPVGEAADAAGQAEATYHAVAQALAAEGGGLASIVAETAHLRDVGADVGSLTAARHSAFEAAGAAPRGAAFAAVGQAPLDERARFELAAHAVVPRLAADGGDDPSAASPVVDEIGAPGACDCPHCTASYGVRRSLGPEVRLQASALCGQGDGAYAQTLAMFERAEAILEAAGLAFRDVVRTWIHLREMDRDYDDLNAARRAFFTARGIDPPPASTGIGGAPSAAGHDLCLGFLAIRSPAPVTRAVMHAPTLNEAPRYGADFVRGMRVVEANKDALYVSGTASIDEAGRTAHPGDVEAQAERMLRNVSALLEGQGAAFGDIASATTYLRHPADADKLRAVFRSAGYEGFPHVLVEAPICRPDLLCETEAISIRSGD